MLVLRVCFISLLLLISVVLMDNNKPFKLNFHQNDYKIKFEWGEVVRFNKRYVKEFRGIVFKYNRTCTASNLTYEYNYDLGNDLEVLLQAYKFTSNEYRIFPIRLQVNFCVALSNNLIGSQRYLKCGNFSGCSVTKGKRYHFCNFAPDPSQFPPFIPNGRYKAEFHGLYHDEELWLLNLFLEVYRPFQGNY